MNSSATTQIESLLTGAKFSHPFGQHVDQFMFNHHLTCERTTRIDIEDNAKKLELVYFYNFDDQTIRIESLSAHGQDLNASSSDIEHLTKITAKYIKSVNKYVKSETKNMRSDWGREFKRMVLECGEYRSYFSQMPMVKVSQFI